MLQVLVNISLEKICCRKETWGYAKEKVKKEREKKVEKNGHKDVQSIENNGYRDARHEKREITPALANISTFNKRDMFQGA
jgi:hypothetical protein